MNSFKHSPVLLDEVLATLAPKPGGKYLDATIGGGGHAAAILTATGETGWLLGVDRDGAALTAARDRLAPFIGQFELRHGAFDRLEEWAAGRRFDGVLLDLGVSSPQLDRPERGFSFQQDGPLDMRMDQGQSQTAADLANGLPVEELERIFVEYGEEPRASRLARLIVEERNMRPLVTTRQLANLVERGAPRRGDRIHPATRVFQALRIAVNDELGQLQRGLEAAANLLVPHGRLAVITFHSLEARRVKRFGLEGTRDYEFDGPVDIPELRRPRRPAFRWVARRAVTASDRERVENPRSRSAQLRVLERLSDGP